MSKTLRSVAVLVVILVTFGTSFDRDEGGVIVDRAAAAIPPAHGCPEGTWCGIILDQNGGCKATPCCPEGEANCLSTSKSPFPFPRGKSQVPGRCLKTGNSNQPYCLRHECGGAILCSEPSCAIQGEGEVQDAKPIIVFGDAEGCSLLN